MLTPRPIPESGSSWTTTRPMSPKRPGPICQPVPTGLNMSLRPSTSLGSIKVETLFSKMSRTFLRHICVGPWAELKERIEKGIAEINANPVIHRWKNFESSTPKGGM